MNSLRDGSIVTDPRLDRIAHFDPRSRLFGIMDLMPPKAPRSRLWRCSKVLDQGAEGACVGFGVAHELIATPAEALNVDARYARESIYWEAQKKDPFPGGSYPGATPQYEGTTVLAGLQTIKAAGWCQEYRWSFGLDELIRGIGFNGPAILGLPWYEGMFRPDAQGFIHATGELAGGHCLIARGVNVKTKTLVLHNSWGPNFGIAGDCFVSFDTADKLLHENGEAAFLVGRHKTPRTA